MSALPWLPHTFFCIVKKKVYPSRNKRYSSNTSIQRLYSNEMYSHCHVVHGEGRLRLAEQMQLYSLYTRVHGVLGFTVKKLWL